MLSRLLARLALVWPRLCVLAHLWFDDFKWKHFFTCLISVYGAALVFLGQIGVPARYIQAVAWAVVIAAAVMYIINPKHRDWESVPLPPPGGVDPGKDPYADGGEKV